MSTKTAAKKNNAKKTVKKVSSKIVKVAQKAIAAGIAETKKPRVTVASFMREQITAGYSNEEVFAAAKKMFDIGDDKKHYPSWYRCEMKRDVKK